MRRVSSLAVLLIFVFFVGCGGNGSSPSPTPAQNVATTTALTATPNPAMMGAPVSLTATVTATSGTPAGTVTFLDGTTTLGTGTLASGTASLSVSTLAATMHSLTASFAGSTGFNASTSPAVSLVVNALPPVATMLTLTATPNPAAAGATVTLTANLTAAAGSPTGSITFLDGTTSIGTASITSGSAILTTSTLAAGTTHSITASYAGSTGFAASTSLAVPVVINAAFTSTASFTFSTPNQTIVGFGGAEAFYGTYLDNHPNEAQIMKALYDPVAGLGITFLRLQNNYYNFTGTNAATFDPDNTKLIVAAAAALGAQPTVLMSAWTPPASLKSNNSPNGCLSQDANGNCNGGFGTLAMVNGAYNYAGYGQFWASSLQAYAKLGVVPNYISIQNEPDFPASYVGCLFNPTEAPARLYQTTQNFASYGKAFDATYQAIHASGVLTSVPQMIGPESFSPNNVQALLTEVPANELAVVAHHLYGTTTTNTTIQTTLASVYPTSMKFETEFYDAPGFKNAIDIHNELAIENANVYLYWGLTWPSTLVNGIAADQQGMIYVDNPFAAQSTWAFPTGWAYNDSYYTMKHFSYFIRPGYIRYNAAVTNANEDISVYQSPDKKTTVVVVLNTSATATDTLSLNLSSITSTNSAVYRSSFATPITTAGAERWNNLGAYNANSGVTLAPQSVATIVFTN